MIYSLFEALPCIRRPTPGGAEVGYSTYHTDIGIYSLYLYLRDAVIHVLLLKWFSFRQVTPVLHSSCEERIHIKDSATKQEKPRSFGLHCQILPLHIPTAKHLWHHATGVCINNKGKAWPQWSLFPRDSGSGYNIILLYEQYLCRVLCHYNLMLEGNHLILLWGISFVA